MVVIPDSQQMPEVLLSIVLNCPFPLQGSLECSLCLQVPENELSILDFDAPFYYTNSDFSNDAWLC